ncbi:MAG: DinB family protein [Chloroflexota bacterium]
MTDALLTAARYVVKEDLEDLRRGVEGLPGEALDWEPAGADTNSMAVLVTHVLHSTRSWLCVALGQPLPDRDRDSEFQVKSDDANAIADFMHDFSRQIMALLDGASEVDWGAIRQTHARPGDREEKVPAAWALLHAIEHLREHVAHVGLTRQLWDAR